MRASLLRSDTPRRLSARERKVVAGGAAVSVLALVIVLGVLPLHSRWTEREATLEAKRGQLARLEALVAGEQTIRRAVGERQRARPSLRTRLLSGASPALAGSNLLALLQQYAVQSRVSLDRVGVVDESEPAADGLPALPVQLSARGDIYGLVNFLANIQYGEKLLVIDEITVNSIANFGEFSESPGDTDLLNWTLRLQAPYMVE
jgi:hypothetical protein